VQLPGASRLTTVTFDLGGVLIDWDPRYLYRSVFDDEAEMERFLAEVTTQEWNSQQDAGRPWAEAVEVLTAEFPEHRDLIEAYHLRWHETLGDAIDGTVEILAELRDRGYVQTAEALGFVAVRYTDSAALRVELEILGLLERDGALDPQT
jgi:FMN phosphatase YigB (HAD superfamily)